MKSKPKILYFAHGIAIFSAIASYAILELAKGNELGGFGMTIGAAFLGIIGFIITLLLIFVAMIKSERPIWAYFTCLIPPIINFILFK